MNGYGWFMVWNYCLSSVKSSIQYSGSVLYLKTGLFAWQKECANTPAKNRASKFTFCARTICWQNKSICDSNNISSRWPIMSTKFMILPAVLLSVIGFITTWRTDWIYETYKSLLSFFLIIISYCPENSADNLYKLLEPNYRKQPVTEHKRLYCIKMW